MGKFDGYVLVSDFDGTLIDHQHSVSPENVRAVRRFIAEGGRFLGATGRTELNVIPFAEGLPMTSPWILYNGAAIYDWSTGRFIYKAVLDRPLTEAFLRKVMAKFPGVNVQVFMGGPFAQVNPSARPDTLAVREAQYFENKPLEAIVDDWLKVLFCTDLPEEIAAIEAMLGEDPLGTQVHKTHSGARYFELTAPGVTKGSALKWLKEKLQPTPRCVVAIGDYTNDVEMLCEADIAAAPESALAEVKAYADIITNGHTESAIADLIDRLESYDCASGGSRAIISPATTG
ncbi:HAD family hydrolase [Propionivibrio soli]|uniref:HAD family hydrolase n=1 Tax=Propionivibrio soli TaxID=2976531 RepID=UPI0021E90EF6|nr:HAD family hydrolase [Propionivibrio soli]